MQIDDIATLAGPLDGRRILGRAWIFAVAAASASFPLALLAFYASSTPLRLATIAIQLCVFAYMLLVCRNRPMVLTCVSIAILCAPIALANGPITDAKSSILPLCFLGSMGCAWCAFAYRKTFLLFEVPFFAYLGMTVYLIVVRGYGPGEFNEFYSGISRNGYSAILFATACGYVISRDLRGLRASLLLLAIALACTIPLYGRSSIAAMAVLFAAVAMKRWPRLAIVTALLATVIIVIGSIGIDFLASATNFKAGIESERWTILDEYSSFLNPGTLVLGVPFDLVWSIRENGGSPDIAFLRLHSYLGIGAFFFIASFAVSAWTLLRRRRYLLLGVFAAVMFRGSTDIILMFGTVDFLFIATLFYPAFEHYWLQKHDPLSEGSRRL
jgi:hypothetical protein